MKPVMERIAAKTAPPNEDGCLIWRGSKGQKGNPFISVQGKTHQVRRLVWEHANGPIEEGRHLFVIPSCDNADCINVAHLYLAQTPHQASGLRIPAGAEVSKFRPPAYQPEMLTAAGETKSIEQWLLDHRVTVSRATLLARLRDMKLRALTVEKWGVGGPYNIRESYWTPEKALFTPAAKHTTMKQRVAEDIKAAREGKLRIDPKTHKPTLLAGGHERRSKGIKITDPFNVALARELNNKEQ